MPPPAPPPCRPATVALGPWPRAGRLPAAILCLLGLPAGPAAAAAPAEELFDGSTFAGWNGDTAAVWRIEEGAIVAGSDAEAAPRNEFLATNRSFGDFELRLEYRIDDGQKANAGVQFRSRRVPNHHEVIGYQADIGPGFDGCLYDESRRNTMLAKPDPDAVAAALARSRDGWHEYVIRCQGPRIRLTLNGVETVNYTEPDPSIPREGMIALQIHGGMRAAIRYRNIRIREFPPLMRSDFRLAAAAEGWTGSDGLDAAAPPLRLAGDPDEHGVRIAKGFLTSPAVPVEPFGYYRLSLLARGARGGLCAAEFLDGEGTPLVADIYDAFDPAAAWQPFTLCFRGHPDARRVRIHLRTTSADRSAAPLDVKNVRLEAIDAAAAADWTTGLAARCPVVAFDPGAGGRGQLPRSLARLAAGGPLRVVMLGDSICNDTSNSLWEAPLARFHPGATIEVVTSVRGSTGCWYYKDEDRVGSYVLAYRPDLVIIAGISHRFDVESIRSVIRQIRSGSDCEILVLTGAVAPREVIEPGFLAGQPAAAALDLMERFPAALAAMCAEEQAAFFDFRRVWDDYMQRSYLPFEHFARDAIHANSRGKAVLGRILGRFLTAP